MGDSDSESSGESPPSYDATPNISVSQQGENVNGGIQSSLRDMPSDLTREYVANLTADDAINDVEKDAIRVYTREVRFLRQAQEKLDQVIAERDAQPEEKRAMYTERVNELRRMITKHYDQLTNSKLPK
jgi:Rps23 Pro-64 3,4-dihydroxylase Tpa1-like proline 4-hydroxylase